jgi:ADP-ribosyl-[dinitrogen reductase] hydrolase
MMDATLDRSVAALLGLAIGDALGAPVEGEPRDSYPPIRDFRAGGPHGLAAGEWTDDTAMAICLAESLLARGGVDGRDLMARFLRWYRDGENACTGRAVGISAKTRLTIETFAQSGRLAAREAANAGNGCIMRLAPVAIFHHRDPAAARRAAMRQAAVTHAAAEAVAAAGAFAELLVAALATGDARAATQAVATKARAEISSAPRARDTLEAALWSLSRADDFETAVIAAVNLGGDTDTIGAVTGQVAGAVFGTAAIPHRWIEGLRAADRLAGLARRLHAQGAGAAVADV